MLQLKKLLNKLKWYALTGKSNLAFVDLHRNLAGLYYRNSQSARLLNGLILGISTMRGGVCLQYAGELFYLRHDRFNDCIYVQRQDVTTKEFENFDLWDKQARFALEALKQLLKHNPFVPSNEGVQYVGY